MNLDAIADTLRNGGVIAYPTEAVWGLGCLPECEAAVQSILALKNRSWTKGLILVASQIEQVQAYTNLSNSQKAEIKKSESKSITFLVPKSKKAPLWITGEHQKIAIRISDHPAIQAICERLKSSLVSTSANPSGKPPAISQQMVIEYFPDGLDGTYYGDVGGQLNVSEIRDLVTGEIIRGGT